MKHAPCTINSLAAELVSLKRQARALGLFVDDRELAACPRCGLMEDVTATGVLITCRPDALGRDTGLRFQSLARDRFRCPACNATFRVNPAGNPTARKITGRKR